MPLLSLLSAGSFGAKSNVIVKDGQLVTRYRYCLCLLSFLLICVNTNANTARFGSYVNSCDAEQSCSAFTLNHSPTWLIEKTNIDPVKLTQVRRIHSGQGRDKRDQSGGQLSPANKQFINTIPPGQSNYLYWFFTGNPYRAPFSFCYARAPPFSR